MKKTISIISIVIVAIMVLALPLSAATPYHTYTYSIDGKDLRSPDAYVPDQEITSAYMGLTDRSRMKALYPDLTEEELKKKMVGIKTPTDLEVDENNNVYIADKDNSRIVVLDPYYKLKFIIDSFKNASGNIDSFKEPQGVFITQEKIVNGVVEKAKIYVCDTGNQRIVTFDTKGNFLYEIGKPQSELLTFTGVYRPIALAVDRYDRLYVVSEGETQGIIVMTDSGEFTGYIGGQQTKISAWDQIWRRFKTEEQQEKTATKLADPYNNITLAGDFIYVTTTPKDESAVASAINDKSKEGTDAPVKMLNAAGSELMRRNGFYPPSGEIDFSSSVGVSKTATNVISGVSTIVDVAVGPENTWSIIDNKRSKVFTYDFDGNLLFAFGDIGSLLGNIDQNALNAITYQGDKMLLLNRTDGTFTVYSRTEYGDVLIAAIKNQNERRYDAAIEDWTEVLKRNSNFDAAYIGIGNALYRRNDYKGAVEQYKYAYDTENYSKAYSELRQQWVSDYLWLIPIIIAVICVALYWFTRITTKINKKTAVTSGKRTFVQELLFGFHLILHPFDGFWDLKHEKRGSVRAGTTFLVIAIATVYYQSIGAGYVSNPQGKYITIWGAILSVCVPLALWIVGNWCITTLFDGEGSVKDVYIASTYSLLPLIITTIPATIASNFVLASELKMISLVTTIGFVWLGLLLFFGMMVTHDYTIGKNVITTLATLVGMICIMFIVILFSTLLGKLVGFVTNIVSEIQYRI
ncbi:MAG: hypothetical protein E7678_00010 [Ruminococcaceae bacterium]|nr:hypothetical protein [Oscillospiraceae bacterium]